MHGNRATGHLRLPSPVATDEHFLPNFASASITVGWGVRGLAAFLLLVAAPDLLRRRPGAAPVAQGSVAVEGSLSRSLLSTASCLDRAGAANIAFHLHFAVRQIAPIAVGAKDMFLRPIHPLFASVALPFENTLGITTKWGQSGVRAGQLKVLAAEVTMICGPGVHVDVLPMAVELHAILAVASLAAPVLFLR